jgi:hypothetical protein
VAQDRSWGVAELVLRVCGEPAEEVGFHLPDVAAGGQNQLSPLLGEPHRTPATIRPVDLAGDQVTGVEGVQVADQAGGVAAAAVRQLLLREPGLAQEAAQNHVLPQFEEFRAYARAHAELLTEYAALGVIPEQWLHSTVQGIHQPLRAKDVCEALGHELLPKNPESDITLRTAH